MRPKTRDAAFGKWGSILGHIGLNVELLDGKHQTCPLCSAKHKFRYTDYKSNGEWICVCGQGDGFDLLMQINGWSFTDTAKAVDHVIGNEDCEETFKPEVDYEKRRNDLNHIWSGAQDDSIVRKYLCSRGINDYGRGFAGLKDLRGHPALYNADIGKRVPAMVALIRNKAGAAVSIHRTFIDPRTKKIMPPTEKIVGAGVHLGWWQSKDSLVIGEGIETTLKGVEVSRVPGLAAISAHGMENLIVPKRFTKVLILADNDRSFTGQKAAFTLARKLDTGGRDVQVVMSSTVGEDFLDAGGYDRKTLFWSNNDEEQRSTNGST